MGEGVGVGGILQHLDGEPEWVRQSSRVGHYNGATLWPSQGEDLLDVHVLQIRMELRVVETNTRGAVRIVRDGESPTLVQNNLQKCQRLKQKSPVQKDSLKQQSFLLKQGHENYYL